MASYETFAAVYDEIMDDSLYDDWTAFSLRHFPEKAHSILELACGTGIQAVRFAKAGFEVTGLDLSYEMLEVAQKRAEREQAQLDLLQADMLDMAGVGTFDVVTCYSDSLCYMPDEKAVAQVFSQVANVLKTGGRFLFDVHSIHQMDDIFPGYAYHENYEDFAFVWDTYEGEEPHSIAHELTFFVKEEDGRFTRRDELHEERTYPIATFEKLLKEADFSKVQVYADFGDQAPTDESLRWFFVAEK